MKLDKNILNFVIGGLCVDLWVHSFLAGVAYITLLAVISSPDRT